MDLASPEMITIWLHLHYPFSLAIRAHHCANHSSNTNSTFLPFTHLIFIGLFLLKSLHHPEKTVETEPLLIFPPKLSTCRVYLLMLTCYDINFFQPMLTLFKIFGLAAWSIYGIWLCLFIWSMTIIRLDESAPEKSKGIKRTINHSRPCLLDTLKSSRILGSCLRCSNTRAKASRFPNIPDIGQPLWSVHLQTPIPNTSTGLL